MKNKKILVAPLGIAGASVGFGILGDAFNSQGLKEAGETTGKFIAPAINITMGGYVLNQLAQLKNLNRPINQEMAKKKRKKKK